MEIPFRLTMASLDITLADNKPVQVIMTSDNTRFLLCTLHKKKVWQVPLDLVVEKGAVITLSCNGAGFVHLTGYFKDNLITEPDESWIKCLALSNKQLLNNKIKELKTGGACLEELSDYLTKNKTTEVEGNWLVKQLNEKEQDQKDKQDATKRIRGSPKYRPIKRTKLSTKCDQSCNFNDYSDEDSDDSDRYVESDDGNDADEDEDENDESSTYGSPSERKNNSETDIEMQESKDREFEKREKNEKQERKRDKIIMEKSKKEENGKMKMNDKQQKENKNIRNLEGGVQAEVLRLGTGKTAEVDKYVTIYYLVHVQAGDFKLKIDECEGLGFRFKVGAGLVLPGLEVGVIGMKVGEKRRLIIPHSMGFGVEGCKPDIPPFATIIYDVELITVE